MTTDLAAFAKEKGVKYFMISFTDLFGGQRAKLVPAQAIADMQEEGAGFAGFATWLDMTPAHPDMLAVPDPSSVIQLPWKPEVAWVAGNCVMEGEDVAQAPRNVLRRLIDEAADMGMHVKTGIEAEFFLLTPDGEQISDPFDTAEKPCYDQQAVMRRYDVVREICDYMLELGWGPYQNDHEDANGQFEMNWEFDDVLRTADKHSFFKFMTKSVAEKHGFRATFMPKPVEGLTGNGCHAHISVWDAPGSDAKTNVFAGEGDGPDRRGGPEREGQALPRRHHETCQRAGGDHQPDGELLQADQRTAHHVRCDMGAEHCHMDRQQPHPHGPRPRTRPVRAASGRWRDKPLSAAGGDHRGGPVGHSPPRPTRDGAMTSTCMPRAIR